MATALPDFEDLPVIEKLGLPHAWDVWGRDDDLGTVNLLTAQRVQAAAELVRDGEVFSLSLPLDEPNPPLYGREPLKHTLLAPSRNDRDDRIDSFYPQASTQWDGLRHVRCREFGFWGGLTGDLEEMAGRLGIEYWAEHGIIGRGVLLDVERYLEHRGDALDPSVERGVTAEELEATAAHQGVTIEIGDILCIRFGWVTKYLEFDDAQRKEVAGALSPFPGLRPDEAMARRLWDWHVAAVACDNPAVEQSPGDPKIGSLHRRLLPLLGMAMGELFVFDALAARCAADDRWDFMFASVPLNLPGGVGSPPNAVAIR